MQLFNNISIFGRMPDHAHVLLSACSGFAGQCRRRGRSRRTVMQAAFETPGGCRRLARGANGTSFAARPMDRLPRRSRGCLVVRKPLATAPKSGAFCNLGINASSERNDRTVVRIATFRTRFRIHSTRRSKSRLSMKTAAVINRVGLSPHLPTLVAESAGCCLFRTPPSKRYFRRVELGARCARCLERQELVLAGPAT
jgi:hypothetical protein